MRYKHWIATLPPYKPPRLISRLTADITKLSSNENPLGPSPLALQALEQALSRVHRYPDSAAAELKDAIAARFDLAPDQVACSNGSDEMVLLLALGFLEAGDEVVMANGTFISYYLRTLEMGASAIRVPLHNFTHDLEAMAAAITPRTRMVFICNPNNPTGTSNSTAEIEAFLASVPEDVLVVMDEAYIEFVTRPDYPNLLPRVRDGQPNLILLRTFAKIYGLAGLRLGYALANRELIGYLERARPTFNVNSLAQAAGIAALNDDAHVARSREHTAVSRTQFVSALDELGIEPLPSETNFVAFYVGNDMAAADLLRERGFTITPLSGWGIPGYIRVSFGTSEQNQRFLALLPEVLAAARVGATEQ